MNWEGIATFLVIVAVWGIGYLVLLAASLGGAAAAAQREHIDFGGETEPPIYRGPCRGRCCRGRRSRDLDFTGV